VIVQEEYDFVKVGTFASQVAFQYVLDTLYSILYAKEYRSNVENLKVKTVTNSKWNFVRRTLIRPSIEKAPVFHFLRLS